MRGKFWDDEHRELLRALWPTSTPDEIAANFGITVTAVMGQAYRMKLGKPVKATPLFISVLSALCSNPEMAKKSAEAIVAKAKEITAKAYEHNSKQIHRGGDAPKGEQCLDGQGEPYDPFRGV